MSRPSAEAAGARKPLKKIFCPSHRKFRPVNPYANYKIDHAMIVGDWS
jgi:hypothetical protein